MAIFAPSESPAIVVKEVDLTGGVPNVQSTTAAFAGNFSWGPVNEAKPIGTEAELASTFGAPTDSSAVDFLTAASFLRYSNSLQTVRVADSDAVNANNSKDIKIDNLEAFEALSTDSDGGIYARFPGTLGNSLKVSWANSSAFTGWDYEAQFDTQPGSDEAHIIVADADGKITGTAGTVLERYAYVSTVDSAVNTDGSSNYMKDVVNRASNWIYLAGALQLDDSATLADGTNGAGLVAADYVSAMAAFEDKDTIQLDFLVAPGMADSTKQTTVVDEMTRIAIARKDLVAVTSPSKASCVDNSDAVTDTVDEVEGYDYTSYLFVDNNWLKVYDKYNDKYRYIPAAGSTAGLMAASDANSAPWFSPAGARRGRYFGVTSLAYTPTKTQRDTLYKAGINPIANLPGQGVLLFGDKTHMNRPSAFDRVNVRRLFNVVERAISLAARNTLFELNDEFTRAEFVNIVEPFLREIKGRRGITDFRVVCDETNNTPAVVDRNEFIANIFIKPARSINYITLNFVAVRSGVDFEEVAGTSV